MDVAVGAKLDDKYVSGTASLKKIYIYTLAMMHEIMVEGHKYPCEDFTILLE